MAEQIPQTGAFLHSNSEVHVSLRALEPSDADFMYQIENDTAAWRYAERVAPLSRSLLREYALNYDANPFSAGQLRLIIVDKDSGVPVGLLDFYDISVPHRRSHLGIYILPPFRERQFALHTLAAAAEYARKHLHLRMLVASIDGTNAASVNLFKKAGYTLHQPIEGWFDNQDSAASPLIIATLSL